MPLPSRRDKPVRAGVKRFRGVLAWKIYLNQEVLSKVRAQNRAMLNRPRKDSCGCIEKTRRPVDKVDQRELGRGWKMDEPGMPHAALLSASRSRWQRMLMNHETPEEQYVYERYCRIERSG